MVENAFSLVVCNHAFVFLSSIHVSRLLAVIPFTSIAASAKIAPRLAIYTVLACSVHKPDIAGQEFGHHVLSNLSVFAESGVPRSFNTTTCGSDPVVQAAVAKLIAGLSLPLSSALRVYIHFSRCRLLGRLELCHYGLLGCSESTRTHQSFYIPGLTAY